MLEAAEESKEGIAEVPESETADLAKEPHHAEPEPPAEDQQRIATPSDAPIEKAIEEPVDTPIEPETSVDADIQPSVELDAQEPTTEVEDDIPAEQSTAESSEPIEAAQREVEETVPLILEHKVLDPPEAVNEHPQSPSVEESQDIPEEMVEHPIEHITEIPTQHDAEEELEPSSTIAEQIDVHEQPEDPLQDLEEIPLPAKADEFAPAEEIKQEIEPSSTVEATEESAGAIDVSHEVEGVGEPKLEEQLVDKEVPESVAGTAIDDAEQPENVAEGKDLSKEAARETHEAPSHELSIDQPQGEPDEIPEVDDAVKGNILEPEQPVIEEAPQEDVKLETEDVVAQVDEPSEARMEEQTAIKVQIHFHLTNSQPTEEPTEAVEQQDITESPVHEDGIPAVDETPIVEPTTIEPTTSPETVEETKNEADTGVPVEHEAAPDASEEVGYGARDAETNHGKDSEEQESKVLTETVASSAAVAAVTASAISAKGISKGDTMGAESTIRSESNLDRSVESERPVTPVTQMVPAIQVATPKTPASELIPSPFPSPLRYHLQPEGGSPVSPAPPQLTTLPEPDTQANHLPVPKEAARPTTSYSWLGSLFGPIDPKIVEAEQTGWVGVTTGQTAESSSAPAPVRRTSSRLRKKVKDTVAPDQVSLQRSLTVSDGQEFKVARMWHYVMELLLWSWMNKVSRWFGGKGKAKSP